MLSHTLFSCVCCNACRNTWTSSSEEDRTTLSTDSSRTVCDTTSAASDAEALDLAALLTATDVEEEQEEDDEYLSLQLFSFFPFGDLLKSSHTFLSFVNFSCFSLSDSNFCCFDVLSLVSSIPFHFRVFSLMTFSLSTTLPSKSKVSPSGPTNNMFLTISVFLYCSSFSSAPGSPEYRTILKTYHFANCNRATFLRRVASLHQFLADGALPAKVTVSYQKVTF